jgi:hypothetical protein
MTQRLQLDDRGVLVSIIAGLYSLSTLMGRDALLQQADLGWIAASINLFGSPRVVAADLVNRLENFGRLAEKPKYHALGAFLSTILTRGELSQEEANFIANVIMKYSLVDDPTYIDQLAIRYDIARPTLEQPEANERAVSAISNSPSSARPLKLTGTQIKRLHQALIGAFSSLSALSMMVRLGLDEDLAMISRGGSLADVVFDLIQWAETHSRTEELIKAAYQENPGNTTLRAFVEQVLPDATE